MIQSGLVSITFRKLSAPEIVDLVKKAGLRGIEWGGDVHVPHGQVEVAKNVRELTVEAGLEVAAYGSYYRAGCEGPEFPDFSDVMKCAVALEAPVIRVWAGDRGSKDSDQACWDTVVEDTRRIADIAGEAGMDIAFEFHNRTLTDTAESAQRLLETVNIHSVRSYWQPDIHLSADARFDGLKLLTPWLGNLHVFCWEGGHRKALADGADEWRRYFGHVASTGRDHFAMLEFVVDDDPNNFLRDAETLKQLLAAV